MEPIAEIEHASSPDDDWRSNPEHWRHLFTGWDGASDAHIDGEIDAYRYRALRARVRFFVRSRGRSRRTRRVAAAKKPPSSSDPEGESRPRAATIGGAR